ncbi:MAG TPA: autotransporter-associated beta strand repeat-containing protein [Candidatus Dormibacteraeota bacterium]|nr:autotransporter-associated beta strand repeat-containing protein [Candidatus Dormibacteraeota bacterium]
MKPLPLALLLSALCSTCQLANGQSTWSGAGAPVQNWSSALNWSGGLPTSGSTVTFPDGAFPVTTNVQGAVNNIVQSSTTILTLSYNNGPGNFHTTQIPSGTILTVNGNVTVGPGAIASVATFAGGGTLVAGAGTSTLAVQSTTGTAILDLSPLTNFVFNAGGAGGPVTLGTSAGGKGTVTLAAGSNNITATTLSLGNNNTSGNGLLNLGNGTNIINADTITMAFSKTVGTMQFLNNAGGGLKIANHTGTGRATLNVSGEANTGSTGTANNGFMLFNGGTVNILGSTLTLGNRVGRAGNSANGVLSFDSGTVDITTINMALNVAPTSSGTDPANGTIAVGGGTLIIGNGGMSMVNQGGTPGAGILTVTNGGAVICSNNIYKSTSAGVATITMSGATLTMASLAGTVGVSNGIPIDNFAITNSTLTLAVATSANIAVNNFNPDATTHNTINVSAMPSITAYPAQFPIISYTAPSGNLDSFVLGTLPPSFPLPFQGYISNNTAAQSIDLVITNGPIAKADQWGGAVSSLWDNTTLNWTNAGAAVTYNDLDLVTFDDQAQTGTVNLTGTRKPATLTLNNNVLNYTFNGIGKLSGATGLSKNGNASLTLAQTGGDNFSGGIAVNGGTLVLDDAGSAIAGGMTIAGGATVQIGNNDANGALPSGALDNEGTLLFKRSDNFLVGTVITGGGAVSQIGSGTTSLSAVNTYSGNTTVSSGTLALTNSGSIATSPQVSVTSAALDVSGVSGSATLAALNLTNASLTVKVGYLQTNLNLSELNMGGSGNTINVRTLPPIASYPTTVTLLQSANPIVGYNFVLGTLPAGSPSYAGSVSLSGDQTSVLLTLTAGPIGVRPSVTWSGVDAVANVNTNWSDAQNWQSPGAPGATEPVTFNSTAMAGGSPFDQSGGVGSGGSVNLANINNIVAVSRTIASLSYANASGFHNTQIASGQTLTVNGSLNVNGAAGAVSILGGGAGLTVNNPSHATTISVQNGNGPTLDMSGLDTFTATANQIGVGYNPANSGSGVNGTWYLAKTNLITTGAGFFGTSFALVVGSANSQSAAGTGTLYLGKTNALYVDGIVLGMGPSIGDVIAFNPNVSGSVAYVRGIAGDSSRVTVWSLGDSSANLNNHVTGFGHINDFSAGTLNALVSTLTVGQGAHGNTATANVMGTFSMGAGNLDVTTLNIGASGIGVAGSGIGIMNVTGGTVVANNLAFAVPGGGQTGTAGTLNLTNATLVVSNGITVGSGTGGGTLDATSSTVKLLGGASITGPATITLRSAAILDLSALPGGTLTLSGTPTLSGNGVIRGSVIADVGSIVSPGEAAIGALTVTNALSLLGTTAIEVDKNAATNDVIRVAQTITYGGTLDITNLNGTVTTSDSFKLFYAANYAGAFDSITGSPGPGLAWDGSSLAVNGTIKVVALPVARPVITSISISGPTLNIMATNGALGGQFVLLSSTNVVLPISQWIPLLTNNFAPDGTLSLSTNIINPAVPREFFMLSQ